MSEPKFAIGEAVAVCLSDLAIVVPATTVVERAWMDGCERYTNRQHKQCSPYRGWYYGVNDQSCAGGLIHERCLRPILPGEYLDTTQDQALPVDGVSA